MDKTCGECKHHDKYSCLKLKDTAYITSTHLACIRFCPKKPTNGDAIRQCSNRELAEISVYEDTMSEGEIIYRSTLIVDKFFLTKNCAVAVVEAWLNAPAESDWKDE